MTDQLIADFEWTPGAEGSLEPTRSPNITVSLSALGLTMCGGPLGVC